MSDTNASLDSLFARLIEELEADPRLDVEAFLHGHAGHAPRLRQRLDKLRRAGFLSLGPSAGSVLHEMRERFGLAGTRVASPAPTKPERTDELLPSRVVGGRYRIVSEIGRGGMGRVFRALDVDLGREIALKVVDLEPAAGTDTPQRRAYLERFLTEAQVTAQLEHPSIVPLHDIGIDRTGELYYTMKLVAGRTLEALIDEWHADVAEGRPFPTAELLRIVLQICDALALAHERGVIHRDLKPSNVMIGRFGEVHVMDWGVAKLTHALEVGAGGAPGPASSTTAGQVVGTPSYMAPEQASGDPNGIDHRADVYGVGAILEHALTGAPPRAREGSRSSYRIPVELRAITEHAMRAERGQRYASVHELAKDLRAYLKAKPVSPYRDGPLGRLTKAIRRRPTAATGIGSGIILALVCALAFVLLRGQEIRAAGSELRERTLQLGPTLAALDDVEDGLDKVKQRDDRSRSANGVVNVLASWGLTLDAEDESQALVAVLGSVEPAVRKELVGGLYQLVRHIALAGIGQASHYFHHGGAPEGREEDWRLMAENHLRLVRIWPRVLALLDTLEDQVVGAAAARALERWLIDQPPGLELPPNWIDDADTLTLDFVSFVMKISYGHERARPLLDAALERDPGGFWLHERRAKLALEDGDEALARIHASIAVALRPKSKSARSNLSVALSRLGEREEAIRVLRSLLANDPDYFYGIFNLAEALMRAAAEREPPGSLEDLEEPIALLERAREMEPEDPDVHHLLGLAYDRQHAFDSKAIPKAIESFRRWSELSPDSWEAFYRLAQAHQLAEEHTEALEILAHAMELSPGNEEILFARIDSLWESRQHDLALESCIRTLKERDAASILELYGELVPLIENPEQRALHKETLASFHERK